MTDIVSKKKRSKIMSSIRAVSKLEDKISKALWNKGVRFRRNTKSLKGTPDFSIKKYKVVIFIDSCYWHFCPIHGKLPKTNIDFWENKFKKNIERDKRDTIYYKEKGWFILRIWEHEFKNDFDGTINKIVCFINQAKKHSYNKNN